MKNDFKQLMKNEEMVEMLQECQLERAGLVVKMFAAKKLLRETLEEEGINGDLREKIRKFLD